jgi:hypothetical protein
LLRVSQKVENLLPLDGGGKNKKHPLSRGREYYLPTHSEKELEKKIRSKKKRLRQKPQKKL